MAKCVRYYVNEFSDGCWDELAKSEHGQWFIRKNRRNQYGICATAWGCVGRLKKINHHTTEFADIGGRDRKDCVIIFEFENCREYMLKYSGRASRIINKLRLPN